MGSGDADMISRAEQLEARKAGLEDAVNQLSMQKNVLIGQQMEEVCARLFMLFVSSRWSFFVCSACVVVVCSLCAIALL